MGLRSRVQAGESGECWKQSTAIMAGRQRDRIDAGRDTVESGQSGEQKV